MGRRTNLSAVNRQTRSRRLEIQNRHPAQISERILSNYLEDGAEIEYQDVWLNTGQAKTIVQKIKRQWRRIHSEVVTYKYIRRQNLKRPVLHIETAPWQSWILIRKLSALTERYFFITMHNSLPSVSNLRQKIWKFRLQYLSKLKNFHLFTSNQDTKNSLKGWVSDDFWKRIDVTYTCVDPVEIEKVLNLNISKEELRRNIPSNLINSSYFVSGNLLIEKEEKFF